MKYPAFDTSVSSITENIILIDWLTVTCYGYTPEDALDLLGMAQCPFEDVNRFMNGYPCRMSWNGVNILYGADDPTKMPDPEKVNPNMGLCITMSGTGCRSFESYGRNDWMYLFDTFFTLTDKVREKKGRRFSFNVTRLDLAYDDHTGIFDIYQIAQKVKDREYVSPSKYSEIIYSDDQDNDLQGLNINIGSAASDVRIRIYDKAAERGFKDRHWIRIELQLRDEHALAAVDQLRGLDSGFVFRGILIHYLRFVDPTEDTNKSRWPISDFWFGFLYDVDEIRLLSHPGTEYNIKRSEFYLFRQYGQLMSVLTTIYDESYIYDRIMGLYSFEDLAPKYKNIIRSKLMEDI